jgi:poly-gamma-glutamate synthesis protein (capsule biosynthesis protein)
VRVFLAGDVMTGRGVDQILAHPGDPQLWEPAARDARDYVRLAEQANGPIPRPVDDGWPWGDALAILDDFNPHVRLVNLETSITESDDVALAKGVHYRMAPANLGCLRAARLDAVALANNHMLDFGRSGLLDTLDALAAAAIVPAGAGRDAAEAARPAIVPAYPGGRAVIVSVGDASSGLPPQWMADDTSPGVCVLSDLSRHTVREVLDRVDAVRAAGDVVVVSIHWGSNWGYEVERDHVEFAHGLVDGGVDIVFGHSSHHPRPIEVYRDRLILYGAGDLIDDYEGIGGYEEYRPELRLLYLATLDPGSGALVALRMAPLRAMRMRLERADARAAEYLCRTLNKISSAPPVTIDGDGQLVLAPQLIEEG